MVNTTTQSNQLVLPDSIQDRFEASSGLDFRDGEHIPAKEIWRFLKEDAPVKFPYTFELGPDSSFLTKFSGDIELFSAIKRNYVYLNLRDRFLKAHANGAPTVYVQGYQTVEAYHAARAIPIGTGFLSYWASNLKDGQSLDDYNRARASLHEEGRKVISPDACHGMVSVYHIIQSGVVPIDYVAPFVGTHCSEVATIAELHRSGKRKIPILLVDGPADQRNHHSWDVKYQAENLRRLTETVGKHHNVEVTDEVLFEEIKLANKARKLVLDYAELWWSAKTPPTGSHDHITTFYGVHRFLPETTAVISMIQGAYDDVKYRVKHGIKGYGLADDPKRLFCCGGRIAPELVDKAGAVIVGTDVQLGQGSVHAKETGDPFYNLAESIMSLPHELPYEERAEWVVKQVRKSRADGVTFSYQWGCNSQSAAARIISDIIKEETGLPTLIMEPSERGTETLGQVQTRAEAFIEILA